MSSRFSQTIKLAAQLGIGIFIFVVIVGVVPSILPAFDPQSALDRSVPEAAAAIGSGIDEFSAYAGQGIAALSRVFASGVPAIAGIGALAIAATYVSRRLALSVRGLADTSSFAVRAAHRAGTLLGLRKPAWLWGKVYDGHSGEALPFATVYLVSVHGHIVDRAVTDARGRYGFPLQLTDVVRGNTDAVLEVRKSGYYFPMSHYTAARPGYRGGKISTAVDYRSKNLDIPLDSASRNAPKSRQSGKGGILGDAAFWLAVGLIPLSAAFHPSLALFLAAILLVCVAVIRSLVR